MSNPKQNVGMLGGAVGGGLAGAQFGSGSGRLIATGVGTLLGAGLGANVGRSLDRADAVYADRYNQRAQVPVPGNYGGGYYPQSGGYEQRSYYGGGGGCRLVDDSGFRPVYACDDGRGGWVLRQ